MAKSKIKECLENKQTLENGLIDALNLPGDLYGNEFGGALNNTQTLYNNISQRLLSLEPMTLNYAYKTFGFLQTAIDQPVLDAFRGGVDISSATLSIDELEELKQKMEDEGDWEVLQEALKWSSLFGGGVVIANTDQNSEKILSEKKIIDSKLKFIASDRWETTCLDTSLRPGFSPFLFHGMTLHQSKVKVLLGKTAPYYVRMRLQGWGISELDATLPPLTQYLKSMNVVLELLDEAKIDILKVNELASILAQPKGTELVRKRVDIAAANKNYKSMLTMDTKDEYDQKQVSFSGLPDILREIRVMISAYLKIPMSKLFGIGSSGFSSGEDDLENYNTLCEAVRFKSTEVIKWMIDLRCMQLFGRKAPDIQLNWKSLRVLTENEMEDIRVKKVDNMMKLITSKILTPKQAAKELVKDDIIQLTDEELNQIDDDYQDIPQEDFVFE